LFKQRADNSIAVYNSMHTKTAVGGREIRQSRWTVIYTVRADPAPRNFCNARAPNRPGLQVLLPMHHDTSLSCPGFQNRYSTLIQVPGIRLSKLYATMLIQPWSW